MLTVEVAPLAVCVNVLTPKELPVPSLPVKTIVLPTMVPPAVTPLALVVVRIPHASSMKLINVFTEVVSVTVKFLVESVRPPLVGVKLRVPAE